ncbi:MAG TPA: hypothetical protein DCE42_30170 [Myxococcales bacterium]|nr:hypothetical protein [Myxococcales bacterium]
MFAVHQNKAKYRPAQAKTKRIVKTKRSHTSTLFSQKRQLDNRMCGHDTIVLNWSRVMGLSIPSWIG